MNILFVTLFDIRNIENHGIYEDLLREFSHNGHQIYIVSPTERRNQEKTHLIQQDNATILKVRTGNIQKTNLIEKGIATVLLESQFVLAIKKFFSKIHFDLILYSTPPITLAGAVKYIKKRDKAVTYLLLKDIFPQNAVDIGILTKNGIKGVLYSYFRKKESRLYELSDCIGCMSQANVEYILKHNPKVFCGKVGMCPNCVEPQDLSVDIQVRNEIRNKYGIPLDKKVFVYGGNLGKPQGVSFIIECLETQKHNLDVYFLIVGDGTEYDKLFNYVKANSAQNVMLMKRLNKEDYDRMVAACDVGLIFLDYRFTIPNYPSRLLSYMQARLPVLCVTDPNSDIGKIAEEAGFGWWCKSNNAENFAELINSVCVQDFSDMGTRAWEYLNENYTVEQGYNIIMESFEEVR